MKVYRIMTAATVLLLMGAAGTSEGGGVTPTDIVAFLREFGFPIFVSVWFMWRLEKRLDAFTESIQKLLTVVTVMSKAIDEISTGSTSKPLGQGKDVA